MSKHTPAPWLYDAGFEQVEAFDITGNRSLQIKVNCSYDEIDDNYHLIAAAPELLEALKDVLISLEDNLPQEHFKDSWYKAIAKAEGNS